MMIVANFVNAFDTHVSGPIMFLVNGLLMHHSNFSSLEMFADDVEQPEKKSSQKITVFRMW